MIYHIYANRSNIGDWLSAKGIQKLLETKEITECLCDEPFIEETMKTLSKATKEDLIIIGGGGLLMDYFIPFWNAFKQVADTIPFIIWGIGYCDIKQEDSLPPNSLVEEIVNKSNLCILRDELSRSYLPHCSLPLPVPCPSINYIDPVQVKGSNFLHVVNYTTAGADTYEAMCDIAKSFTKNSGIIYRETNNIINKGSEKELSQILSLYKDSDIILSSALHGCIIGVAMGLKVIAVSGDRKIEGFMESVGLQEWVLDTTELNRLPELLLKINLQNIPSLLVENIRMRNKQTAAIIKSMYSKFSDKTE